MRMCIRVVVSVNNETSIMGLIISKGDHEKGPHNYLISSIFFHIY